MSSSGSAETQSHVGRRIGGACLIGVGALVAFVCGLTILIVCGAAVMTGWTITARALWRGLDHNGLHVRRFRAYRPRSGW